MSSYLLFSKKQFIMHDLNIISHYKLKKSNFIIQNFNLFSANFKKITPFIKLRINQIKSYRKIKAPMGIDGLLNLLRPVTQKQHISSFKNQTVAIDAMPWIYKGCYSCAMELNQNVESIDFLYYILQMLDMLSYYNIKPIFVFDGRAVYAKNSTLQKRKKSKQENKQKGLQFLKNNQLQEARKYLSRCIIIDQRIITMTINCLVTKNIEFIVAPYEADCQIAKLKRLNMIDAVISQDSDLIIFGLNVILKLNQNGECDYVDLTRWKPKDVSDVFLKYFLAFDQLSRIDTAILAGSDYNQSVKGIGIKRAIKLLTTQVTMNNVINKLKYKKTYMDRIPQDYQKTVEKSKLIFNLSTVYNPIEKKLQFLRPELLDQLKPLQMTNEQLLEIVGIHYQFNEQVAAGRVSSKTLQKRDIKSLNFPQIFRVNKQNMMAHQAATRHRKIQQQKSKEQKAQQEVQNRNGGSSISNNDEIIYQQLNQFKKRAGRQQTEQQIQKRKQERKNRIARLQQLMNTIVDIFGDSDDEDVFGDNDSDEQNKKASQTIEFGSGLKKNKATAEKLIQNDEAQDPQKNYLSQQQSVEQDLGFLNPFIKKDLKPFMMKQQHINGSKKK